MKPFARIPLARSTSCSAGMLVGWLALCSISGGLLPHGVGATTHLVTSLADPGTDGCTPEKCTLREALAVAQDGDTLTFEPALFTNGPQTLRLKAGALFMDKHLTLVGPGQAMLVISGRQASGVLRIPYGKGVVITKVTITRGLALPAGGIDNSGTLTLVQSTVSRNTGSGIVNRATGTLSLRQSRISANTFTGIINEGRASLSHSTVHGNSTGIANVSGGVLTLRQSTVSGNAITGLRNGGTATLAHNTVSGNGTGIFNDGSGLLTLRQSTVSSNTVTGLFNGGELRLHTTIIAGNVHAQLPNTDCAGFGTLLNDGFNLTGLGTGCASDARRGDLTVDPARVFTHVLKPLRHHGGPTTTHALWPQSPVLDAGDPARCGGTDQRGVPRPQGPRCDIGAFERERP